MQVSLFKVSRFAVLCWNRSTINVILFCHVIVPVKLIVVPPSVVTVQQGERVKLQCLATGYPSPTITWSRVDEVLESSRVSANGSLIIESAKKGDSGQYMCTAKNAVGKKTYSFSLDMQLPVEGKIARRT